MLILMDLFVQAYSADAAISGPGHSFLAPEPQHTASPQLDNGSPEGERGSRQPQEPPEGCFQQRADVLARGSSFESLQSAGSHSSFRSMSSSDEGFSLYRLLDVDPELLRRL